MRPPLRGGLAATQLRIAFSLFVCHHIRFGWKSVGLPYGTKRTEICCCASADGVKAVRVFCQRQMAEGAKGKLKSDS